MNYINYIRVSTREQGDSMLGIEAQQAYLSNFAKGNIVLKEYVEIESGKNNNRPLLLEAIDMVNRTPGSILLISRLDRLSRSVSFISTLMDSKVPFTVASMPEATSLTIHIYAALAQQEREMISIRTKEALAALKARGKVLGTPANLTDDVKAKGVQAIRDKAASNPNNIKAKAMIILLRDRGLTFRQIADQLNTAGFKTSRNKIFTSAQVHRLAS